MPYHQLQCQEVEFGDRVDVSAQVVLLLPFAKSVLVDDEEPAFPQSATAHVAANEKALLEIRSKSSNLIDFMFGRRFVLDLHAVWHFDAFELSACRTTCGFVPFLASWWVEL